MNRKYVIASTKVWDEGLVDRLSLKLKTSIVFINKKEQLTIERLKSIDPTFIFFPHWSHIIPKEIHESFECVIFHMTDVPFGRGGSPLQNLIEREIIETKISALKCVNELDAGPVYLKKSLSLLGNAEEIFIRASKVIEEMILEIIYCNPTPTKQEGLVVEFKRRKPEESKINGIKDLEKIFDFIRMLDGDGYPKAFIETEYLRLEFERASLKKDYIHADVKIKRKEGNR